MTIAALLSRGSETAAGRPARRRCAGKPAGLVRSGPGLLAPFLSSRRRRAVRRALGERRGLARLLAASGVFSA